MVRDIRSNHIKATRTTTKKTVATLSTSALLLFTVLMTSEINSNPHSSFALSSTFNAPQNISINSGTSALAHSAIVGGNVYTVWTDKTAGNQEIFFAKSTDGGANFGATVNISNNPGQSISPQIITYSNTVLIVWGDNTAGNQEIF